MERLGIAVIMTMGYLLLRKVFNVWDQKGEIQIRCTEVCLMGLLFYITLLFVGNIRIGCSFIVGINLIFLAFHAYIDAKTKLLYSLVLYFQITLNFLALAIAFICGLINLEFRLAVAITLSYFAVIWLLCLTKAISKGDGLIYTGLFPVLLIAEKESISRLAYMVLINLMVPLISFVIMESVIIIFKYFKNKHLKLDTIRKPFAPYLLFGFVGVLILIRVMD